MIVMRVGWVILAALVVGLSALGYSEALQDTSLMRSPDLERILDAAGVPIPVSIVFGLMVPFAVAVSVATLIFVKRGHDPVALTFSAAVVCWYGYVGRGLAPLREARPALDFFIQVLWFLGWVLMIYFLFTFPNGRFVPRWTRRLAFACVLLLVAFPGSPGHLMGFIEDRPPEGIHMFGALAMAAIAAASFGVQGYRFRHHNNWTERQQVKWALLPLIALTAYIFLVIVLPEVVVDIPDAWMGAALLGSIPLGILTPLGMGGAILRFRLYDVDLLINRALVYGGLTAFLGASYLAVVILLQAVLPTTDSDASVVASTLAVAALFGPARARIQATIDRRFYRSRYDARKTLEGFGTQLRDEVDLEAMSKDLIDVVGTTMRPAHASLWLKP